MSSRHARTRITRAPKTGAVSAAMRSCSTAPWSCGPQSVSPSRPSAARKANSTVSLNVLSDCVYLRRILDLMGYPQTTPTLIALLGKTTTPASISSKGRGCTSAQNTLTRESIACVSSLPAATSACTRSQESISRPIYSPRDCRVSPSSVIAAT